MTTTAARPDATGTPGYSEIMPCEPESARRARLLVAAALNTWGLGDQIDEGRLIVSELVANVIEHTGGGLVRIDVRRLGKHLIRIDVADNARATPKVSSSGSDSENGRGLLIVNALSHRWGYDHCRSGKVVWAKLLAKADEPGSEVID